MVIEAFLTCALSLHPAVAFNGPDHVAEIRMTPARGEAPWTVKIREELLKTMRLTSEFLQYSERRRQDTQKRVLVIDSDMPDLVRHMREYGFRAFGLHQVLTHPMTPYSVLGDFEVPPFLYESFYITYWINDYPLPKNEMYALRNALLTIEQQGFFVFDPGDWRASWVDLLMQWNWFKLPFKINGFEIWQKPVFKPTVSSWKQMMSWTFGHLTLGMKSPHTIHRNILRGSA